MSSPAHILSTDLVESVSTLAQLTPPLAAIMHSMPRPRPPSAIGATVPLGELDSEPEPAVEESSQQDIGQARRGRPNETVEQGDEALLLEVTSAEAAKRALLSRIAKAEELLAISSHNRPT